MKIIAIIFLIFASAVLSQGFLEETKQRGGLHDYIFRLPRDTLINWALASEKYHRKVNNQDGLVGGLVDYVFRLSNQDIISKILKVADEHPEIASQEKLQSLATEYGFSVSIPTSNLKMGGDGGLHDYIWRLPRDKLITWALTSEAYHRDVNHQHLFGGLDDYVSSLSNQKIIEYIMSQVKEHPELSAQGKLDSLSVKYNIDPKNVHTNETPLTSTFVGGDGGLHDYIWRLERPVLNNYALAAEQYHREKENIKLYGGLHDYINVLSNEQVIEYIMKQVKQHPELGSSKKLDTLVVQYGISQPTLKSSTFVGGDGGLHDYIWRTDRKVLNKWALTAEKYHLQKQNITLFGGLHDYINVLSNEQVIEYILKQVKQHPEIGSSQKLDSLSVELGIAKPVLKMGGLNDYIWRLPRTTLDSWALACERYHNKEQNLFGGLHDYIGTFSNQQVIDYIMNKVKENPELGNAEKLNALVAKYGFKNETSAPQAILGGGLHDVVRALDRKSLISYALAIENYSNEKSPKFGGIHDYIDKLEDDHIRKFILDQAKNFPELNSREAIEGLVKKYNLGQN